MYATLPVYMDINLISYSITVEEKIKTNKNTCDTIVWYHMCQMLAWGREGKKNESLNHIFNLK